MLRYLTCLLLLALSSYGNAFAQRDRDTYNPSNQSFEVSGQVNFANTNGSAPNVPVRLERFSGGLVDQMNTDNRGRFRFSNLQRGFYKVIINAPGYGPAQQEADLTVLFKIYLFFALVENDPKSVTAGTGNDVIDARVPADAREQFELGRSAFARKNYLEAIMHLDKAVAIHSSFFEAHLLISTALIDLKEWDKAQISLQRALELKPENPTATISLGEVYWRLKRFSEAEETLLAGLKLNDKSWHGHFTLARLYLDMNEVMKAAPHLGMTLQLKPDFAEAHVLAGNVFLKLNQQQRALLEYEEYLRLAPKGEFALQAHELVDKLNKSLKPDE